MGASLKDIACKLNLSKTTVSWVLSGQGDKKGISAETQSRVLACARSLAYEPNLLARSLNTGVSKTIGLILPSISDTFFAHIADRIESEAEREGYSLMIAGSNSETERENALIRLFRSKKVDGIIIAPADASGCEVGRLAESGCPVVLFDRCLAKTDAGCVVIDNPPFSIIAQIVRFYLKRGIKFFLFAPHLTLFSADLDCTRIVCGAAIVYENGAKVNTSFLSNMFGEAGVIGDPVLYEGIDAICSAPKAELPKYKYPDCVLMVSDVAYIVKNKGEIRIDKREMLHRSALDAQKKHGKTR